VVEVCVNEKAGKICFDTSEIKSLLDNCVKAGKTLNQCLSETGWDKYIDVLKQHGVIQ